MPELALRVHDLVADGDQYVGRELEVLGWLASDIELVVNAKAHGVLHKGHYRVLGASSVQLTDTVDGVVLVLAAVVLEVSGRLGRLDELRALGRKRC